MQSPDGLLISKLKVRVPFRRDELIARPRLVDALYEQLEKRLLLIVAPAGYGKTSLLVDFSQQCDLKVCWLSVDALDQEPQRFLLYLVTAIAEAFPDFGRDSLAALASMTSFEQDEERLLVTLTNEIQAQISEHFVLILDDYHLIGSVPLFGHLICRLLQLAGENLHIILASRNLPDLPDSPLLVARNQVGGLTFESLAFQANEIQQLFQQNNGISLSLQDAASLVEETEGWIAAIHLTKGQPGTLPRMHPFESTRELFDFFSREILSRQTEQVRRFLLMTSFFDAFDISLCAKVLEPLIESGGLDWPAMFETVRSGNLFCVPADNEGRWMRYHHLFQHFLRSQLQYEQPALAWHLQQNLARAYEDQEAWEEALYIYSRLDDQENLARLLIQIGPVFILAGRILTLANWLDKLPLDTVYSQPELLSLLAQLHATRGDNHGAVELFNLAEEGLRNSEKKAAWVTTLFRRAETCRQLGYFDRSLADSERILELTKEAQARDLQVLFAEAQRIKGLTLFGMGHMKDALIWLEDALRTCRTLGITNNIPILETELGVVHRRLGNPEITARYYASALKAWENAGNTGWKARLLNNLGLLYHLTGRLNEALPPLQDALRAAERSGYVRIQTNVLISLGDLLVDLSDVESAYVHYDRALTLATNLGHSQYIFYASLGEARLQRLSGETALAIEELKQTEMAQVSLGIFERAMYNLELGCCWLEAGKILAAIPALQEAVALFGEGGNQMEQTTARLWLEVAHSVQDSPSAGVKLKELLPPQKEMEKSTPLMLNAARAGRWLKKRGSRLLKDPGLKIFFEKADQVQQTVSDDYRKLFPRPEPSPQVPPRLEIRSFGPVQVWRNQRAVELSDWQTREARDLFFFLLQSPALTKEQIALEFWPDISPARLKMRFKINVYRVRQALGQDVILFEGDRYRFNREVHFTWDREKLDEIHRELPRCVEKTERIQLLEKAVSYLKGDYLADVDGDWAVAQRLKYQDLYRELLLELAQLHLQNGHAHACLSTAAEILRSDPLLEPAHRLTIQAYAALHNPAAMTVQFHHYQQILKAELGLQPSSEIRSLYEKLMAEI